MYVEIKNAVNNSIQYVYLKRSVRVKDKVKHYTVERLGRLDELLARDPNIIDKLKHQCSIGDSEFMQKKMLAFDRKLQEADLLASDPNSSVIPLRVLKTMGIDVPEDNSDLESSALSYIFAQYESNLTSSQQDLIKSSLWVGSDEDYKIQENRPLGCVDAVVVAAGVGSRMGACVPKQYLKLDDKCILEHTVLKLLACPYVLRVIVVISEQDEFFRYTCISDLDRVTVVNGGKERSDSVMRGVSAVKSQWCLVHDAARPFVLLSDIERLLFDVAQVVKGRRQPDLHGFSFNGGDDLNSIEFNSMRRQDVPDDGVHAPIAGGLLVAPSADTLKQQSMRVIEHGCAPMLTVGGTIDRSQIYRAQTPQLCHRDVLNQALTEAIMGGRAVTDEASALEALNYPMLMVPGSSLNIKITEPSDYLMACALIKDCCN